MELYLHSPIHLITQFLIMRNIPYVPLRTGSRDRVATLLPRIQVVQVVNQWPKTGYLDRGV